MFNETQEVWNRIAIGSRTTVTTTNTKLNSLVTAFAMQVGEMKAQILTNIDSLTPIYYSKTSSNSVANAEGVIYPLQSVKMHFQDKHSLPYFIAASNVPLGVIVID